MQKRSISPSKKRASLSSCWSEIKNFSFTKIRKFEPEADYRSVQTSEASRNSYHLNNLVSVKWARRSTERKLAKPQSDLRTVWGIEKFESFPNHISNPVSVERSMWKNLWNLEVILEPSVRSQVEDHDRIISEQSHIRLISKKWKSEDIRQKVSRVRQSVRTERRYPSKEHVRDRSHLQNWENGSRRNRNES